MTDLTFVLLVLAACEAIVLVVLFSMWRDEVSEREFWYESSCRARDDRLDALLDADDD